MNKTPEGIAIEADSLIGELRRAVSSDGLIIGPTHAREVFRIAKQRRDEYAHRAQTSKDSAEADALRKARERLNRAIAEAEQLLISHDPVGHGPISQ